MDELHAVLDSVDGTKQTQRLLAAIAYKNGVSQTELAEWFDTGRRTIYSWLQRLDTDEERSRRLFLMIRDPVETGSYQETN